MRQCYHEGMASFLMHWRDIQSHTLGSPVLRFSLFGVWSVFAGLAFASSVPPKLLPGIEWVGLAPFLVLLLFGLNRRELFFYGWLAFTVATGIYTSWMFSAFPPSWLYITNFWVQVGGTLVAWLAIITVLGLAGGMFLLLAKILLRGNAADILSLALLIAAMDYGRSLFAAAHPLIWGPGSIARDNWAMNILGYALADYPLLRQVASIGGLYSLSFIVGLTNALLFSVIRTALRSHQTSGERFRKIATPAVVVIGLLFSFTLLGFALANAFYQPGSTIRIAIISTDFSPEDWQVEDFPVRSALLLSRLIRTAAAPEGTADIILMPENSALPSTTPGNEASFAQAAKSLLGNDRYRILINLFPGGTTMPGAPPIIILLDSEGEQIGRYVKRFLIPFGEYLPTAFRWTLEALGQTSWLERHANIWYQSGEGSGVFAAPFGTIGVLGCAEIMSPALTRQSVAEGAEILVFTSSTSTLRGSKRLRAQNLAIAQIRAASARRFIAYAANGGHSFFVGPDGTVLWENPLVAPGVKIVAAKTNAAVPPGIRYEIAFPVFAAALLFGSFLQKTRMPRVRHNTPPLNSKRA